MEKDEFYSKAEEYWSNIPATIDGVLGGFGKVNPIDISYSKQFLMHFIQNNKNPMRTNLALDVGAGIGRVTKNLLSQVFTNVDLLESDKHFLAAARQFMGPQIFQQVRKVFPMGLQEFDPASLAEGTKYDCIWCQWVLSHLRDDDLVEAFKKLKGALADNGVIFVKENMAKTEDEVDEVDSSVTRTRASFLEIFRRAGLTVLKEGKQTRFPAQLYEVRIFALR